jgi:hypothetical protein
MALPHYQSARAFPDGAPWGAANPNAAENCGTCHFDNDAVHESALLVIDGLPDELSADTLYELVVRFDNAGAVAAGFQMIVSAQSQLVGNFSSPLENTESAGAAIRSTAPIVNNGSVSWPVQWRTPTTVALPIEIYVAALAANGDQSPLGDTVHFQSYEFRAE